MAHAITFTPPLQLGYLDGLEHLSPYQTKTSIDAQVWERTARIVVTHDSPTDAPCMPQQATPTAKPVPVAPIAQGGPRVALQGQPIPDGSSANTAFTPQHDSQGELVDLRVETNMTYSRVAESCIKSILRCSMPVYRTLTGRGDVHNPVYLQGLIDDGEFSDVTGGFIYTVADAINHAGGMAARWAQEDERTIGIVGSKFKEEEQDSPEEEKEIGVEEALGMSEGEIGCLTTKQRRKVYSLFNALWKEAISESKDVANQWRKQIDKHNTQMKRWR